MLPVNFLYFNLKIIRIPTTSCSNPVCHNDPVLCPQEMICEPELNPVFFVIDAICVYIFAIEYACKAVCYTLLPPR